MHSGPTTIQVCQPATVSGNND